jgi:ribosomal-protein-alanine N-acetyltransferase
MRERTIEGPRVFLSRLVPEDVDDRYLSWFEDEYRLRFYTGSGKVFNQDTILAEISSDRPGGEVYVYGVFVNESELLIGTIKIGPVDSRNQISDLVVHIGDRENSGKGVASEAISLGNSIAFNHLGIRKLYGGMFEANIAAIKAYTRGGWVIEGRLRDHYLVDGQPMDRVLVACFKSPPDPIEES